MNTQDFNTARATLGFDLTQTAAWLGINPSTAWRYANGHSPIPGPVARALRLACGVRGLERVDGRLVLYADLAPLLAMEGE